MLQEINRRPKEKDKRCERYRFLCCLLFYFYVLSHLIRHRRKVKRNCLQLKMCNKLVYLCHFPIVFFIVTCPRFSCFLQTASKQTGTIIDASNSRGQAYTRSQRSTRKEKLVGHFEKYMQLIGWRQYSLVSAAQDGKMIVWNAMNTYKVQTFTKITLGHDLCIRTVKKCNSSKRGFGQHVQYSSRGECWWKRYGKELLDTKDTFHVADFRLKRTFSLHRETLLQGIGIQKGQTKQSFKGHSLMLCA